MDRDWLERELAAGRSVESIASEVGRDPSTVAHWMRRWGLRSAHAERHAARGGIAREVLEALIAEGLSSREIAQRLDRSQSTVRHWLGVHGLRTARANRRGQTAPRIESICRVHGRTTFVRRSDGYVCRRCRAEAVTRWRQRIKRLLVEEAGGGCALCGYDTSVAALHFHHLDPELKRFAVGSRGLARGIAHVREEAAKCVLLCANCHAEVESGIATLPGASDRHPG